MFCFPPQGIAMLTFALLMSARMGIFQETLYKEYGKHSKEALFYNVSRLLSLCRGHTQSQTSLGGAETPVWAQSTWCFPPLCSTAYLCQASCSSSVTSTTMASSSAKPVRLAGDILLLFWVSDDQPDAFLLPSSCPRPRGRSLCAHHVALPAGQHHHAVSCQIMSIHSRM